jgi:hypothetical protein
MVAIMLAAVLITSVMVVMSQLLAGSQKSQDLASGAIVAERILNQEVNVPTLTIRTNNRGSVQGVSENQQATRFEYSIDVEAVDTTNTDVGTSFLVTVKVW